MNGKEESLHSDYAIATKKISYKGDNPAGSNRAPGGGSAGSHDGDEQNNVCCKSKMPHQCHRTPWDDDVSLEDSPPSTSSLSEDSSDNEWFDPDYGNKNHKERCKQWLWAKTEDNEYQDGWLKNILKGYKKQIQHYCSRDLFEGPEIPRGIKIPNPPKFSRSNNVKEFDNWLIVILQWIVISRLIGTACDDQCVQVLGSYLKGDALQWYNDEVTGLHCYDNYWTFKKALLGLFTQFVQAMTMHVAAEKFEAMVYDPAKGVKAYQAELQWWGARWPSPPMPSTCWGRSSSMDYCTQSLSRWLREELLLILLSLARWWKQ